jgi:prefoldin subunit 5
MRENSSGNSELDDSLLLPAQVTKRFDKINRRIDSLAKNIESLEAVFSTLNAKEKDNKVIQKLNELLKT